MIWGSIHHSWWQWPTPQGQVLPAPAVQGLHSSTNVENIINSTVIVSGQAPGLCLSSAGVHNHIYLWLSCYGPYFFYITCQNSSTVLLLNQRFYTPAQYLENCAYLFRERCKKKKMKKKLTSVSFMYVCVAENGEMLVFFLVFFPNNSLIDNSLSE